ncbi:MAG: NADH:flavin oxidoreductase/NADH oxidase family protein [Pseudomonadota bacterium]|nr:NADH:flavin oxidoreductase/NADH oxidase family protein [Candidatus Acidoferrales bacterium]
MTTTIASSITLPCGVTLPNRLAKAALTEGLSDGHNRATEAHQRLYRAWSEGGAGLIITGNVQVDRRYLERPGNIAIDNNGGEEALAALARAGTVGGNALWMQLSHAGRQTIRYLNAEPVGPSAVPVKLPGGAFGKPRALTEAEIEDVIERFVRAATVAQQTGFTGVQLHAAHGYLLSEFLSPKANLRTDQWGGTLENRARLLLTLVREIRTRVGPAFPICVKLNSADFQKGGFSDEDSQQVAQWLQAAGVDLLEISGGTYEQLSFFGTGAEGDKAPAKARSTLEREAYFLDYAERLRRVCRIPLMVTGGFRSLAGMNRALAEDALDVIGLGRPMCVQTDLPQQLLAGHRTEAPRYEDRLHIGPGILGPASSVNRIRNFNHMYAQGWYCAQLLRIGRGQAPDPAMGPLRGMMAYLANEWRGVRALQGR